MGTVSWIGAGVATGTVGAGATGGSVVAAGAGAASTVELGAVGAAVVAGALWGAGLGLAVVVGAGGCVVVVAEVGVRAGLADATAGCWVPGAGDASIPPAPFATSPVEASEVSTKGDSGVVTGSDGELGAAARPWRYPARASADGIVVRSIGRPDASTIKTTTGVPAGTDTVRDPTVEPTTGVEVGLGAVPLASETWRSVNP
jgi:hypothetical protein